MQNYILEMHDEPLTHDYPMLMVKFNDKIKQIDHQG